MMRDASTAGVLEHATDDRATRRDLLHLTLAIIAIAFTPILFRLSELGPTATAFYRTLLALPLLAAWMAIERRRGRRHGTPITAFRRRDGVALAAGGIVFAANIACYAWAVHFTSIANASLLSNLSPIFVALAGFVVFGDRIRLGFILAMAAAILGTAILASDRLTLDDGQILGDAYALFSSLFFAAYLVIVGRLRRHLSSATIMLWTGIFTTIGLLAAVVATAENPIPQTAAGWAILIGLAIVSYALGQSLLTVALARLGASFSAVSLLFLPVGAAIQGWALLGERISFNQAIGGVIILGSILGARIASR
jgi:drug/metabolite transporter (DMT)-like permease